MRSDSVDQYQMDLMISGIIRIYWLVLVVG